MRKVLLPAFLAAMTFGLAGIAEAQTATQDITISATVPNACTINNVATGAVDAATININPDGSVDTTAVTPTASPYANVACNAPSNLQLTSLNGAVESATTAAGFDNTIDYQASATWNGETATLDTASTAGAAGAEAGTAQAVATAFSGSLSVSITPTANANPLVAGAFSDTLRVTLTPQ